MSERLLADTSALLCLLAESSEHHAWAVAAMRDFAGPALTTEPVLTETAHLLRRFGRPSRAVLQILESGMVEVGLSTQVEHRRLRMLMERYESVPISLADASLVCLSELHRVCRIFTLDSDFRIYRRHGNKAIPVLMPED